MKWLVEALERRDAPRTSQQLACKLLVQGRCQPGTVRNLSARGMLVETPEVLPPGAEVVVAFEAPGGRRFVLEASAPEPRPLAHSLTRLRSAGVGLRIQDPPPGYLRWVEATGAEAR